MEKPHEVYKTPLSKEMFPWKKSQGKKKRTNAWRTYFIKSELKNASEILQKRCIQIQETQNTKEHCIVQPSRALDRILKSSKESASSLI